MRYTTVIDISEINSLYRNKNAVLLYFHLCLKAGYQDDNRDVVDTSIRRLSADLDMSISAIRNALKRLQEYKLVTFTEGKITVKKWLMSETPTARPKNARQAKQQQEDAVRRKYENEMKAQRDKEEAERQAFEERKQLLLRQGKTVYMLTYEKYLEEAEKGDAMSIELAKRNKSRYEEEKRRAEGWLAAAKAGNKEALALMGLEKWTGK